MRIKDVIKQTDRNGNVIAYVIMVDGTGKESYFKINSEREYNYYKAQFQGQQNRERKYSRAYNAPASNYNPRINPFINYEKAKNINVSPKIIALITAGVIGLSSYVVSMLQPDYSVVEKINNPGIFNTTKESRFIDSNEEKFSKCAEALKTGNFEGCPDFDAEFIREYISTCYRANIDDMITGGKLNGNKYKIDFYQFMTTTDQIYYDKSVNNRTYENFISSNIGDYTLDEARQTGIVDKTIDKFVEEPLSFILNHLDPKDDDFQKLSPYTRIVICEQVKSMLSLEEDDYTFFSHESPNKNATKAELIEQINKKEESAMFFLDMQITQKKTNNEMEGRSR